MFQPPTFTLACTAMAISIMANTAFAESNWPQFRGPDSTGAVADNDKLPETWSATENVEWKTDLPGRGWSSPVV